ncbi:flagellar biosynthetic protein FliQ [Vibrio coralliirubri]|nr:flagellar biosynthetic protein FliQ [Vibrio coralliirubri]MCY9860962.1 flagellar biosynthetic protein FliQ [Vibrio coralliirubri]
MSNQILLMDAIKEGMTVTGSIAMMVMGPLLAVGLAIAIFQAATQINEASLSFIPKLVVIFFIILLGGDMLLDTLSEYFKHVFGQIPVIAR